MFHHDTVIDFHQLDVPLLQVIVPRQVFLICSYWFGTQFLDFNHFTFLLQNENYLLVSFNMVLNTGKARKYFIMPLYLSDWGLWIKVTNGGQKGYFISTLELHKQTWKHTEVAKTGGFKCDFNKLSYGAMKWIRKGIWYAYGDISGRRIVAFNWWFNR